MGAHSTAADVSLAGVVGISPAMREVYELADCVARTTATVLLVGESGTGKEVLARAIAEKSPRRAAAFVAVNCSALPDNLLESELFGHVRGAFTGAASARRGLFEEADGGTLFLDEVGDISPAMQVRLLRVLQESEVKPLGSHEVRKVDVRVIAATNRDLRAACKEGRFRADLYYRLDVFRIRVPPLRARPVDIPVLVHHFVEKHAARFGHPARTVDHEGLQLLLAHPWPGNVRELENVIQRAIVMTRGGTISAPIIGASLRVTTPVQLVAEPGPPGPNAVPPIADLPFAEARARSLESFSRAYLEDALRRSGGQIAAAARLAGMDKSNFRRLLKRCGVDLGDAQLRSR